MGTPERLAQAERDLTSGRVRRLDSRNACPAVFLDRDGVISAERGAVELNDARDLLPGAAAAIGRLNRSDYLAVVVTNQSGVAKGMMSEADIELAHAGMETALGAEGAYLDRIYYCPHHPESGFPGERPELKIRCGCRKPEPGMLLDAARALNIDLARSFFVGDTTGDLLAARRAGVAPVLVLTGHAGADGKYAVAPDATFADLARGGRLHPRRPSGDHGLSRQGGGRTPAVARR